MEAFLIAFVVIWFLIAFVISFVNWSMLYRPGGLWGLVTHYFSNMGFFLVLGMKLLFWAILVLICVVIALILLLGPIIAGVLYFLF